MAKHGFKVDRGERRIGLSIRALNMTDEELKALEAETLDESASDTATKRPSAEDFGGLSAAFDNAFANVEWQPGN